MSNPEAEFEEELELFRKEVQGATQFFYGFLAVNTAAASRKAVLDLMNEAPTFWNTATAGLQLAAFIALHRIFDRSANHSVFSLLRMAERNRHIFSKEALGERKKRGNANALDWLDEYLAKSYVPTANDLAREVSPGRAQHWPKSLYADDSLRRLTESVFRNMMIII
jgi:hypothetical protein